MAVAGLLLCAVASPVAAQEDGGLHVSPTGRAIQDFERVEAVVDSVPSPVPQVIPSWVNGQLGPYGAEATLELDSRYDQYGYDCDQGRCTGFASDIWNALPPDQQQAYVDEILDAVEEAFPGLRIYVVTVEDTEGHFGVRAVESDGRPRSYRWVRPTGQSG